jgi:hypothetical protein
VGGPPLWIGGGLEAEGVFVGFCLFAKSCRKVGEEVAEGECQRIKIVLVPGRHDLSGKLD